jgi:CheY-like chemotaxis protein
VDTAREAPSGPAPGGRAAAEGEQHGGRHALVIEDEKPIRALLVRLLARRGYAVTEAASYAEARAVSAARQFDLVLCDVRLPDGNGSDCLRHLRQAQPGVDRRFVFVTGDIAALGDGEFGDLPVLAKPFTASDLDAVIDSVEVAV